MTKQIQKTTVARTQQTAAKKKSAKKKPAKKKPAKKKKAPAQTRATRKKKVVQSDSEDEGGDALQENVPRARSTRPRRGVRA